MIPEDKICPNVFFNWKDADVKHCREQFGQERATIFFIAGGLFCVRPADEDKKEGVIMLDADEFKNFFRIIENPKHQELAHAGFPVLKP